MEGILHFDVQVRSQLIGEVSTRGTLDEGICRGQQGAEAGEPDLCLGPQSAIIKAGDFAQGIVSAAMGIAGEVIQRLEFAEDREGCRGPVSVLQFVQSCDFVAQQKPAQGIGAEEERPHNVIVPTEPHLIIGTITNRCVFGPRPSSNAKGHDSRAMSHFGLLGTTHQRRADYDR
jgi:hypothetical protein